MALSRQTYTLYSARDYRTIADMFGNCSFIFRYARKGGRGRICLVKTARDPTRTSPAWCEQITVVWLNDGTVGVSLEELRVRGLGDVAPGETLSPMKLAAAVAGSSTDPRAVTADGVDVRTRGLQLSMGPRALA